MSIVKSKIIATKRSPEIGLFPEGFIEIKGRSMIENMTDFSKQIEDWIDKYICNPADLTRIDFYLEYLNTNNIIFYISLLKKIETVRLKNKKMVINWYYEEGDEDIIEKGEHISFSLNSKFNFIMLSGNMGYASIYERFLYLDLKDGALVNERLEETDRSKLDDNIFDLLKFNNI